MSVLRLDEADTEWITYANVAIVGLAAKPLIEGPLASLWGHRFVPDPGLLGVSVTQSRFH